MRWKKIAVGLATTILIAVPSAILIYIAAKPHPPQPTKQFLMNFDSELNAKNTSKNGTSSMASQYSATQLNTFQTDQNYLNNLTNEAREVLKAYQEEHPGFNGLNLHFISLNGALTPGQINYFNKLNTTMMAISPLLKFTLQQPNPITLQEGYYQMNTDMVSFYWSPNYNGLGTWLAYVLSNGYALANLWHPLSQVLQNFLDDNPNIKLVSPTAANPDPSQSQGSEITSSNNYPNVPNPTGNTEHANWLLSLADAFYNVPLWPSSGNNDQNMIQDQCIISGTPGHYVVATASNILQWAAESNNASNNAYTAIDTTVSSWVSKHNNVSGTLKPLGESAMGAGYSPWIYHSFSGGISGYTPSMAVQLVNFLCDYLPNMPYIQNGHNTIVSSLVRFGDHAIINSMTNFRDWYYDPNENTSPNISWWNSNSPFTGTITQYNPSFSQESAGPMIGSTFNTLFSYSNIGDYYNNQNIYSGQAKYDGKLIPHYTDNYHLQLVSESTSVSPAAAIAFINSGFNVDAINPVTNKPFGSSFGGTTADGGGYINFPIIPIPWVRYQQPQNGNPGKVVPVTANGVGQYLSPVDYLDGFKAYQTSVQVNLNSNGYFMQLASINYSKTVDYPGNQAVNETSTSDKPFRLYFNKPALAARNVIGILSNQFFGALPAFNPLVQNIVNPAKFNKIAQISGGALNVTNTNMSDFYGCGDYKNTWQNLDYVSPYVLSEVNAQQIVGTYNPYFFNVFSKDYDPETESLSSNATTVPWSNAPWLQPDTIDDYVNFEPNPSNPMEPAAELPFSNGLTQPIRRFENVYMNYAGGFQPLITYEMFTKNELDISPIPESYLSAAYEDYPYSIYQPLNEEIDQSNLVPYNTNVYVTNSNGNILLFEQNGNSAPAIAYTKLQQDQYGNFEWPWYKTNSNGSDVITNSEYMALPASEQSQYTQFQPKQKTNITSGYNNLIVNNFYTPMQIPNPNPGTDASSPMWMPANIQTIQEMINNGQKPSASQMSVLNTYLLNHSSIIIRSAINNLINWYSLCSVAFPFQSIVMQNSFMPYGVFNTYLGNETTAMTPQESAVLNDPRWRYWSLAAYKVKPDGEQMAPLGKRQGGIVQWTWTQYINQWKQIFTVGPNSKSEPIDNKSSLFIKSDIILIEDQTSSI